MSGGVLNVMDAALQKLSPTLMVPKYETLAPLSANGHRFLVAEDGLWMEVRRPWCHVVWPVASRDDKVVLPYGKLKKRLELRFGELPEDLIDAFVEKAKAAYPLETAAVGVWNAVTGRMRLLDVEMESQGPAHVRGRWPAIGPDEHVVLDAHSHGALGAFFSQEDRRDMGANVTIAMVVGRANDEPELVVSLFAFGHEIKGRLGVMTASGEHSA